MPLIIGGKGKQRTPALAARFATEFNIPFPPLEDVPELLRLAREACEAIERDPATLKQTIALVGLIGEDDADFRRRAAIIGRQPDELRRTSIAGTPDEARERLAALEAQGIETVYLQQWHLQDLEHLELIAAELLSDG